MINDLIYFECQVCYKTKVIEEEFMKCLKCGLVQCTVDCTRYERVGTSLNMMCRGCGEFMAGGAIDYESDEEKEKLV